MVKGSGYRPSEGSDPLRPYVREAPNVALGLPPELKGEGELKPLPSTVSPLVHHSVEKIGGPEEGNLIREVL